MVRRIPEGYRCVTPYLVVEGAEREMRFLKQAFGALEKYPPMRRYDGTVIHAELRIGDASVMLGEASDAYPPMPSCFYLYVEDVDATYGKALRVGGTSIIEPKDQFYGDRSAGVRDPAGNLWWIATHKEDVSEEEIERRFQATIAHA